MTVGIVRTAWAGTTGGPGLTQTAFAPTDFGPPTAANAQAAVNAVRAFWEAIKANLPSNILLTVSQSVDFYDHATGELTGTVAAATAPASVVGTSSAVYSAASGFKVNANTGTVRFGRRVRGAIYVVPAASTTTSTNGLINSTLRTAVNTAAATMQTSFNGAGLVMVVWSRPRTEPTVRAGALTAITSWETNEKVAVLRGRRD